MFASNDHTYRLRGDCRPSYVLLGALFLILMLLAGCATPGNLESGTAYIPPQPWRVYCAEHPQREECKP